MNTPSETQAKALAALSWQLEAGVDEILLETPVNRLNQPEPQAKTEPQDKTEPQPLPQPPKTLPHTPARPVQRRMHGAQAAALPNDEGAINDARTLAASCTSLEELKSALENFTGSPLKNTAKNTVFGDGNPKAPLMLIGEAPGRDEDIQGKPFVGRSGQLLDRILSAINRDRHHDDPAKAAWISNVIPWRPPGNRTPTPIETALLRPFIDRHIELIAPKIIVLLGGVAAKQMLATEQGIMRLRGKWRTIKIHDHSFAAMPTFHPAYLLRQPAQKRLVWQDFLEIQEKLLENKI